MNLIAMHSPQYSNSSKTDLFSKQRSPSFQRKRIPSAQEHYLCFSNQNLKNSKSDSPSKLSEQIRRRKSQHVQNNNLSNSKGKKKSNVTNNAKDIMNSIQDLKDQYKALKDAYKDIIQQKMKKMQEINRVKQQNTELKQQIQIYNKQRFNYSQTILTMKSQIVCLQQELDKERKKIASLQNDLYFIGEKQKIKIQKCNNLAQIQNKSGQTNKQIEMTHKGQYGSIQKKDIEPIYCKSISNQSNMLSFSLTSVLQDSIDQPFSKQRREHVKVLSDLSQANNHFDNIDIKCKKQLANFKKNKKQIKTQALSEFKQAKAISQFNPLNQLLNLKSPTSTEKKIVKNKSSNSKRRKDEDKQNIQIRASKKKSKKLILLISNE